MKIMKLDLKFFKLNNKYAKLVAQKFVHEFDSLRIRATKGRRVQKR